ncbi:TetR/AcrR family transcriptional regulator [Microbacterium suwonense]|uniref:TetR family transcriptional regulator n=1 Tax=Microbacterium suwonense TaxID=683047 RepID=A0ABN6X2A6_9MICO|nr:TetR/AcrR family transcriptional regulator [Microbacterium suwonense]BDZ38258.1 TetR family transcriptional regulator [Microbacterium suwonense]
MDLEKTSRRRGPELDDAILSAAWDQLVDAGYGSFTIEAVAERAGTSRSVVYRRWPDRGALLEATLAASLSRGRPSVPDTGSLRSDMIELLRRSNATRGRLAPLLSVLIASYYSDYGRSFADVREMFLQTTGLRPATEQILERAVERGEADPERLSPRVKTVAFDLFRHELMMTMHEVGDAVIEAIVDEVFLPLVTPRS